MKKIRLFGPVQITVCRSFTVIYLSVPITTQIEADLIGTEEHEGCKLSLSQKLYHKPHDRTTEGVKKMVLMCMEAITVCRKVWSTFCLLV